MLPIQDLVDGFRRFQAQYISAENALFDQLKDGQRPSTLVIGCSDSRVDPLMLLGGEPGDLFVVRNIANLVPPCEDPRHDSHHSVSAALEFSVLELNVKRIIVLGHGCCGGIRALMEHDEASHSQGFVGKWLSIAEPARDYVRRHYAHADHETQVAQAERASILVSLDNLLTFPWVAERVAQQQLALHGWYFDLRDGGLYCFDRQVGSFVPLVPGCVV